MKKFTSVLIVSCWLVLLGGCSLSPSPQQDLFSKKQECASYLDSEKNRLQDFTSISTWATTNKEWEIWILWIYSTVLEIFYSPEIDSCVSIIQLVYNVDMVHSYRYIVRDVLSNIIIWDYKDDDYYKAYILEYGNGSYDFNDTSKNISKCDENNTTAHCLQYYNKINSLK